MIFVCQSSIIHTSLDIHIDIQAGVSMQGHSAMDVRKQYISINGYTCFHGYQSSIIHAIMDIRLDILGFLWISMQLAMHSRSRARTDRETKRRLKMLCRAVQKRGALKLLSGF